MAEGCCCCVTICDSISSWLARSLSAHGSATHVLMNCSLLGIVQGHAHAMLPGCTMLCAQAE